MGRGAVRELPGTLPTYSIRSVPPFLIHCSRFSCLSMSSHHVRRDRRALEVSATRRDAVAFPPPALSGSPPRASRSTTAALIFRPHRLGRTPRRASPAATAVDSHWAHVGLGPPPAVRAVGAPTPRPRLRRAQLPRSCRRPAVTDSHSGTLAHRAASRPPANAGVRSRRPTACTCWFSRARRALAASELAGHAGRGEPATTPRAPFLLAAHARLCSPRWRQPEPRRCAARESSPARRDSATGPARSTSPSPRCSPIPPRLHAHHRAGPARRRGPRPTSPSAQAPRRHGVFAGATCLDPSARAVRHPPLRDPAKKESPPPRPRPRPAGPVSDRHARQHVSGSRAGRRVSPRTAEQVTDGYNHTETTPRGDHRHGAVRELRRHPAQSGSRTRIRTAAAARSTSTVADGVGPGRRGMRRGSRRRARRASRSEPRPGPRSPTFLGTTPVLLLRLLSFSLCWGDAGSPGRDGAPARACFRDPCPRR